MIDSHKASMASVDAGHNRREEEWDHQEQLAGLEIVQIDKQISAAEIRVQIAQKDLTNHDKQAEHSETVYSYMRSKYTNKDLYSWMVAQISAVYYQSYIFFFKQKTAYEI